MWFWNSKEFYMGNSLAEYSRIKQVLANNNIRYDMKMSSMSGSGTHSGTLGINLAVSNYYYIYVHKDDFDKAVYLINRQN